MHECYCSQNSRQTESIINKKNISSKSQLAALLSSGGTHFPFGEGSFALATVALRTAEAEVERLEGDIATPCTGKAPETKLAQTMDIDTKSSDK